MTTDETLTPEEAAAAGAVPAEPEAAPSTSAPEPQPEAEPAAQPSDLEASSDDDAAYTIAAGDSWESIAAENNTTVDALIALNSGVPGCSSAQMIRIGAEIQLR